MFETREAVIYWTWVKGLADISGVSQNTDYRRADIAL